MHSYRGWSFNRCPIVHLHGDAASVSPGEFGDKLDFYPYQLDCIDKWDSGRKLHFLDHLYATTQVTIAPIPLSSRQLENT